jgi:hypothetical protein
MRAVRRGEPGVVVSKMPDMFLMIADGDAVRRR